MNLKKLIEQTEYNQIIPWGSLINKKFNTENDLIIQVSNFSVRGGGIWDSLIIGDTSKIVLRREIALSRDTFFCGSLLMIGLYHITASLGAFLQNFSFTHYSRFL